MHHLRSMTPVSHCTLCMLCIFQFWAIGIQNETVAHASTGNSKTPVVLQTETEYLVLDDGIEVVLQEVAEGMDDLLLELEEDLLPENTPISLPSNQNLEDLKAQGLDHLVQQEITLRKGHMNDTLDTLRTILGSRTFLLRTLCKKRDSTHYTTRAWKEVNNYTRTRNFLVRVYCRSRQALFQLGVGKEVLEKEYRPITAQDLKVNGDITQENRVGQKNDKLPWFWRLKKSDLDERTDIMKECVYSIA